MYRRQKYTNGKLPQIHLYGGGKYWIACYTIIVMNNYHNYFLLTEKQYAHYELSGKTNGKSIEFLKSVIRIQLLARSLLALVEK